MKQIKRFENPTQVIFYDETGNKCTGIGFDEFVICGCCGGCFDTDEIYEFCPKEIEEPIICLDWHDIADAIVEGREEIMVIKTTVDH